MHGYYYGINVEQWRRNGAQIMKSKFSIRFEKEIEDRCCDFFTIQEIKNLY